MTAETGASSIPSSGTDRAAWRSLVTEATLDPGMPIIDPHHHLFDGSASFHDERYALGELLSDTGGGHNVVATMCVNAGSNHWNHGPPTLRSAGETAFVDAQGERASRLGSRTDACRGIVAKVDLTLAEVGEVLDAHQAAAPRRLKGVRHVGLWVEGMAGTFSNKALYDSPAFRRGFAQLAERRLCFDALVAHTQLEQVARLAADFPHAAIILDHFGLPIGVGAYAGRRHDAYNEWFDLIASVAACPNVSIKLGGLNSPVSGFDWHLRSAPPSSAELAEAISPYFVRAVALFGPERCMFESNWPVDGLSSSYHVLWNAFKRLGAGLSIEARHAMFHGNANRIYQLGLSVRGS